jgi:hypothetical protein
LEEKVPHVGRKQICNGGTNPVAGKLSSGEEGCGGGGAGERESGVEELLV